jgi:hypothetical protein
MSSKREFLRAYWDRKLGTPLSGMPGWLHDRDRWFDDRWLAEQWRLIEQTPSVHWDLLHSLDHEWSPMLQSEFRKRTAAVSELHFGNDLPDGPRERIDVGYALLGELRPLLPVRTVVSAIFPFSLTLWTAGPSSREELEKLARRLLRVTHSQPGRWSLRAVFYGSDARSLVFYEQPLGLTVTAALWHAQDTHLLSRIGVRERAVPHLTAAGTPWTVAVIESDATTLRSLNSWEAGQVSAHARWDIWRRLSSAWTLFEVAPGGELIGLLHPERPLRVEPRLRELCSELGGASYTVDYDTFAPVEVFAPGQLDFRYACTEGVAANFDEQVKTLQQQISTP